MAVSFDSKASYSLQTLTRPYKYRITMSIPPPGANKPDGSPGGLIGIVKDQASGIANSIGGFISQGIGSIIGGGNIGEQFGQNVGDRVTNILNKKVDGLLGLNKNNMTTELAIDLFATATSLPKTTLATTEFKVDGRKYVIPYHVGYDNTFEVTYYLDENFTVRSVMEEWMYMCDEYFRSGTTTSHKGMYSEILVVQQSYSGQDLTGYKFFDSYPIDVGQVDLGDDRKGSISTFNVVYAYSYHQPVRKTLVEPNRSQMGSILQSAENALGVISDVGSQLQKFGQY